MVYNEDNYNGYGLSRKTGRLIAPLSPSDGNRSWRVTVQPTIEPVTVEELKIFSKIDPDAEDTILEGFIQSARFAAEDYIGKAFISQTIQTVLDFWPRRVIKLPRPPLISVDKVVSLDEDGDETEYSSTNYYLNTIPYPGELILKRDVSEPQNTTRDYARFLIQSKHGYGTSATDVPAPIREGIMLWAAVVYATRVLDPKNPPPEARSKLDLYKSSSMYIR